MQATYSSSAQSSLSQPPSSGLHLFLLGAPSIRLHGEMLTPHLSRRAQALLYYLAVEKKSHSRDQLASLFWSDLPNQQARKNLRNIVPELRKSLSDYLVADREHLRFRPTAPYWCDLEQLEQMTQANAQPASAATLLYLIPQYQGEFLAGFSVANALFFEEWLAIQRQRVQQMVVKRLDALAQQAFQQGEREISLEAAEQILRLQPWHEAAHRLQMEIWTRTGQRSKALAQYEKLKQILREEVDVEPDWQTEALIKRIRIGELDRQQTTRLQTSLPASPVPTTLAVGSSVDRQPIIPQPMPLLEQTIEQTIEQMIEQTIEQTFGQANRGNEQRTEPVAPSHNLPHQLTPFIGRRRELSELLSTLYDPEQRLITLAGLGGMGKTRLALAAASQLLQATSQQAASFADGIWFASFANLVISENPSEMLASVLADTLPMPRIGQSSLAEQVMSYLRHRRILLIFDSFEHLLPSVPFLLDLLQQSSGLKLLISTRQTLNVQAESLFQLSGLALPNPETEEAETLESLLHYDSIQLFVNRAQRADRKFVLNEQNRENLLRICRLVEGLPLAIELAAVLVRHAGCAKIYQQLQHDLVHLGSSQRDLPARHQSLKALLDSSWEGLSTKQRQVLAACSVFSGSFSLQAAQTVMDTAHSTLDLLVDQSLLKRVVKEDSNEESEERFEMHELVRQYAATQLARCRSGSQAISARHAEYYMQLLADQEEGLRSNLTAQRVIQKELENVRSAWQWSTAQKEQRLLDMAVEALQWFHKLTGLYRQAIYLLETALKTVNLEEVNLEESKPEERATQTNTQTKRLRARLLCHTAHFYWRCSQLEDGERLAREALILGEQMADDAVQGQAYHELARLVQMRGDFATMSQLAELSCQHARQANSPLLLAEGLNDLAVAAANDDKPMAAIPYLNQTLAILHQVTNRPLESIVVANLGIYHLASHEYQMACYYFQQKERLLRLLPNQEANLSARIHWGDLWLAVGAYPQAQQEYEQARIAFRTLPVPYWQSWFYTSLARMQHRCGRLDEALANARLAQEIAKKDKVVVYQLSTLVNLGHILSAKGDWAVARQCYLEALALSQQTSLLYRTVDAQAGLAALSLAQNELTIALPLAEAALAQLREQGLAVAYEPFQVYSTCIGVLQANGDSRVLDVLHEACQKLLAQANKLTDERLRRSFLETVVTNRELLAMAAEANVTSFRIRPAC